MSPLAALSPALLRQLSSLKTLLFSHTSRAYIVGGAVRDLLLGRPVKDIDIEVYDIAPEAFDALMHSWGAKGVGKSFFVYKFGDIDLSLPRLETKVAKGHQGFEVRVCQDERLASKRRDFTINALMLHLFDEKLVDFWGGSVDLKVGVLRLVDAQKFGEDPLRVLRGVRFAASFGFHIAPQTQEIMKKLNILELSQTRITWELEKLFIAPFVAHGVLYMYRLGLFDTLFGITPSWRAVAKFSRALMRHLPYCPPSLRPYLWLFVACHYFDFDASMVVQKLALPSRYRRFLEKTPFGHEHMSDYELVQVALTRPLKTWVGIARPGYEARARALGVYECVFDGGVRVEEVMAEGFCGKTLGEELRRRIRARAKSLYM